MRRLALIVFFVSVCLGVYAQAGGTVRDGMRAISEFYGVHFAFDSSLPMDTGFSGQDFSGKSLRNSLNTLFHGTGIEWTIRGNYVLLRASDAPTSLDKYAAISVHDTQMDTIAAAIITDSDNYNKDLWLGRQSSDIVGIKAVISPLGEGDPVKWVQSLPGISAGADGTNAFYVRGSNYGNNLFTVDGVPVYGYSHIVGLTTMVPQGVIKDATLVKGGFHGDGSNYTSSHLKLTTRVPDKEGRTEISVNNFLISAENEGRLAGTLSYMVSARISPLGLEYRGLKGFSKGWMDSLKDFRASVGDVYGKLRFEQGNNNWIEASVMGSIDRYFFSLDADSQEMLGWSNGIGILKKHLKTTRSVYDLSASVNYYSSRQFQNKLYRGKEQHLSLNTELLETIIGAKGSYNPLSGLVLDYGLSTRFSVFKPGQVASVKNKSDIILTSSYIHAAYDASDRLNLSSLLRFNCFNNLSGGNSFDPEGSLSIKWQISHLFALEGTFDSLVQYYHTLEGLPIGWSLDMIVPSGEKVAPESSVQGSLGALFSSRYHLWSIGFFHRTMKNLLYYKYSPALFSGALAAWEDDVDIGRGQSNGMELLYEYRRKELSAHIAYTLSKTNRGGFKSINGGAPFHAHFDRRHVLNVMAQWRGFSTAFTFQSGHWENGAAETYTLALPGFVFEADYYAGVNDYKMPDIIRLDIGYQFSSNKGNLKREINLGVFNATNHFNPFMLYFDTSSESWKEVALFSIIPVFSYNISF